MVAAGIDGERAAPDDSDAKELQKKLMKEDQDKWTETFNTNVSSVYFTVSGVPNPHVPLHSLTL